MFVFVFLGVNEPPYISLIIVFSVNLNYSSAFLQSLTPPVMGSHGDDDGFGLYRKKKVVFVSGPLDL